MDKLYNQQIFNNNAEPALDATNLNIMSKAISDIDDRVIEGFANAIIAGLSAEQAKASASEAKGYRDECEQLKTDCAGSATQASASAQSASESATLASTTVSDLSAQFQDCIDKIDELLGEEVTANG